MNQRFRGLVLLFLIVAAVPANVRSDDWDGPSAFDAPRRQGIQAVIQQRVLEMFAARRYAEAEQVLRDSLKRWPNNYNIHYNLACSLAQQGKDADAVDSLARSVELGFRDRQHIAADEDLKSLRGSETFREILDSAEQPLKTSAPASESEAAQAVDGQVLVTEKTVQWDSRQQLFRVRVAIPDAIGDAPVVKGMGKAGELLQNWFDEGTAAGNHGDLYDNHDSDHSNMNYAAFPQLTRVEFSEPAKRRGLHHGLQRFFLYDAVTIGNSSTALTRGPFWRCQGRHALTQPGVPALLHRHYRASHLFFYPEHRDHDAGHNGQDGKGYGDVLPANTPYLILSQGSSGSDRAFMNAVAATLAAFRPEVKRTLASHGLLMPTVQMIFRRSNKNVATAEDYLTGIAHPTVFDGKQLDVEEMVTLAHSLTPASLPPLVQLRVVEEDESVVGRDYFDVGDRERLFDTPGAIARIVKSTKFTRRMVVSAEDSLDVHDKPLTFRWVLLRGDPNKVRIVARGESGSRAELHISYHERRPVSPGSELESNRVDIGVFAHNGQHDSPPAFLSFHYLDNERRVYDDRGRIQSVDYATENYTDPLLDFRKDWRDEYHYTPDGILDGWTRIRGDDRQSFDADGRLVLKSDDAGRPVETVAVRYRAQAQQGKPPVLIQEVVETLAN